MECSEDSRRLSTMALLLVQNTLYTGLSWVVIRVCHGRSQAVTGRVTAEIPRHSPPPTLQFSPGLSTVTVTSPAHTTLIFKHF